MVTRFYDHETGRPIPLNPDIGVTGYLPQFLDELDKDSAEKQLHKNYMHGGGFNHFDGFTMHPETYVLTYPNDPPFGPIAHAYLRDELVLFYPHSWVAIVQKDKSFRIARMD
jgi:hypothetical protein